MKKLILSVLVLISSVFFTQEDAFACTGGTCNDAATLQQQQQQQQGTTSGGQSGTQRDTAVKAMGSALDELRAAQQAGDFKAYGDALAKLQKAVDAYENAGG